MRNEQHPTDMDIKLPPRSDGKEMAVDGNAGRLVIIGANGSGKSRFTSRLYEEFGAKAFRLSVIEAIYSSGEHSPISDLFERTFAGSVLRPEAKTEFDRLLAMLMHDEVTSLISYKTAHGNERCDKLPETKLDRVMSGWGEIFPGNNILIDGGRLLFSRGGDAGGYSAMRLSAGEKAVIYYLGGVQYAPEGGAVFVDSPEMFLHPSIMQVLWNSVEAMRPDCTFIYTTHDLEFASSRSDSRVIWVRDYDADRKTWDYDILPPQEGMSDEIYMAIIGARKPVLFIEGDGVHSIDAKLYPLVFKEYTVKSLGSCNKVIEATRSFNDLNGFHHLASCGIVDRDRRDEHEVDYLRGKKIMVPEVAEIENILMLEDVIKAVARSRGRNPERVFERVKHSIMGQFKADLRQQALLHTRHRVKRTVEYRIDGRFTNIGMLEKHLMNLAGEINARGIYEKLCREFRHYLETDDYSGVLRVYNQKSMIPGSNVAALCGLNNKEEYVQAVISLLQGRKAEGERIRRAVKRCFGIEVE